MFCNQHKHSVLSILISGTKTSEEGSVSRAFL